jgi:hypothetical protein
MRHEPVKFTKDQLQQLVEQTKMFKSYFANVESYIKMGQSSLQFFPWMEYTNVGERMETGLEQAIIYRKYFCMMEMYLGLVAANSDLWHKMYIDPTVEDKMR